MKPVAKVVIEDDKKTEATVNLLFEDLYNRLSKLNLAITGGEALDRPHIDSVTAGTEFNYAYLIAHCVTVEDAKIYCWAIRKYGTQFWTEHFSSTNEIKITSLYFDSSYEIKVKAYGMLLVDSPWSAITLTSTAEAPIPSKVVGVAVTDDGVWVDPTTGETFASVKVSWTENAASELVDEYEVLWTET